MCTLRIYLKFIKFCVIIDAKTVVKNYVNKIHINIFLCIDEFEIHVKIKSFV